MGAGAVFLGLMIYFGLSRLAEAVTALATSLRSAPDEAPGTNKEKAA